MRKGAISRSRFMRQDRPSTHSLDLVVLLRHLALMLISLQARRVVAKLYLCASLEE
jgi:hypothetical protein